MLMAYLPESYVILLPPSFKIRCQTNFLPCGVPCLGVVETGTGIEQSQALATSSQQDQSTLYPCFFASPRRLALSLAKKLSESWATDFFLGLLAMGLIVLDGRLLNERPMCVIR